MDHDSVKVLYERSRAGCVAQVSELITKLADIYAQKYPQHDNRLILQAAVYTYNKLYRCDGPEATVKFDSKGVATVSVIFDM